MNTAIKIVSPYHVSDYDIVIEGILNDLRFQKLARIADRIAFVSSRFLGEPYVAGALGEGEGGRFDQNPLYRTDAFDCVTFINTVLALALSKSKESFQQNIIALNYYDSILRYEKRFHFTSADWNIQNAKQNFVKDITVDIKDAFGHPIHKIAEAMIDRPNWFNSRSLNDIKLFTPIIDTKAKHLLNELRAFSSQVKAEKNQLPYLPLSELFKKNKPNNGIFSQIPHGSVIEIVCPNWNLRNKIGTNLNISHLGLVLKLNRHLVFRHASLLEKCVTDVPFIDYLKKQSLSNPAIKGISIIRCNDFDNKGYL